MKAITYNQFGNSSVLGINDVAEPTPGDGEVLIQVSHAGVNPVDWKIREGHLKDLLPHSFPIIPGWDVAGTVKSVGKGATNFAVGQEVYAYARKPTVQNGTYAEFVVLPESFLAKAPKTMSLAEAAGVPLAGLTAWQGLFDLMKVTKEDTVLVLAGSGGVGSFAIQFAKQKGATVVATASEKNHGYLRELGVDAAVDYNSKDVVDALKKAAPNGYSVVFDGAGAEAQKDAWPVIQKGGRFVSIVSTPDADTAAKHNVEAFYHFVAPNGQQLAEIAGLIEKGHVKSPALEVRNIKEASDALSENEKRRTRGKVVLDVTF